MKKSISKYLLKLSIIQLKSSLELLEEQLERPDIVGDDMDILLNMVADTSQAFSKDCKQVAEHLKENKGRW